METKVAVDDNVLSSCWRTCWFAVVKIISANVRIFVFPRTSTFKYSQDLQAKKKAAIVRLARAMDMVELVMVA